MTYFQVKQIKLPHHEQSESDFPGENGPDSGDDAI